MLDEIPGEYSWRGLARPAPGPLDVVVRPVATALNHMDHWVTKGLPAPRLPHVPGGDVAGTVHEVGERVGDDPALQWIRPGSEVVVNPAIGGAGLDADTPLLDDFEILGEHRWGGHATEVVVPALSLVPRPASRSWFECAAYPVAYLTAFRMLSRARLQPGETLLVTGVGGGVSSAVASVGAALGARVVGTSREPSSCTWVEALGVDDVVSADGPWPQADVVADSIGPASWRKATDALVRGGRLVTCGGTTGRTVDVHLPTLFWRQHEIIGSSMGNHREFRTVTEMVGEGLPIAIDHVAGCDAYPAALARLRDGGLAGKIVLDHARIPAPPPPAT